MGKAVFLIGLVMAAAGLAMWSGIGRGWLGCLPGDINVSGGKFSFHFPIVTCVVVSVVLSGLLWLLRRL